MDRLIMLKGSPQRGINGTAAVGSDSRRSGRSIIVKTKMGTRAPITVEAGEIMTFGLSRIEKAKITLMANHVLEVEIIDYLLGGKITFDQFIDDAAVFVSMGLEPLGVCHEGIIAKKFGENR